jgi:hypothetical protein
VYLEGTLNPSISLLKKWEGYYVYSSIGGGFLHLLVEGGIISLPLLRSRHKIPPHLCLVIYVILVRDNFFLVLYYM